MNKYNVNTTISRSLIPFQCHVMCSYDLRYLGLYHNLVSQQTIIIPFILAHQRNLTYPSFLSSASSSLLYPIRWATGVTSHNPVVYLSQANKHHNLDSQNPEPPAWPQMTHPVVYLPSNILPPYPYSLSHQRYLRWRNQLSAFS